MSNEQEKINRELARSPWTHKTFFNRPHWTRRRFFEVAGTGVAGWFLPRRYARAAEVSSLGASTKNTAQNVIFILLSGAPTHVDTFDLKPVPGLAMPYAGFQMDTIGGIDFPTGLMPNLAIRPVSLVGSTWSGNSDSACPAWS